MNVRDVQNNPRRSTGWVEISASPLEKVVNYNSPKKTGVKIHGERGKSKGRRICSNTREGGGEIKWHEKSPNPGMSKGVG